MLHRLFPLRTWLLFALAGYVLLVGVVATHSVLQQIGTPTFGALVRWWGPLGCDAVMEVNPLSWPLLANQTLQPGDCVSIDSPLNMAQALEQALNAPIAGRFVTLLVTRDEHPFRVPDQQVTHLTDLQVFQVQFPLVITSLACWLLALIVLLAQPRAEANGALAGLFFLLALAIISIHHHVDWLGSNVFTTFTTYIALSLVGATAFHVALTFLQPLVRFPWLRFAAYPLALISLWLHVSTVFSVPLGPLASLNASVVPFVIDGTLWFVAFPICIGRLLWILRSGCSAKTAAQVRIILVSWVIGMLPPVLATAVYLINLRWVLPGTTLITFLFFLPIAIAGSAYAMLRYQTFAYRGGVLSGLMLVFVSTALACTMMLILALTIHVIDGIQFVIIWASVLAATLFWYIDTPIRRIFRTHFLRHQDQYQIAYDFAAQSASAFSAEQSLQIAVLTASDAFQSEWAAAWSGFDAAHLVIVDHGSVRVVAASAAPIALLPAAPELAQPLGQDGTIGWLWVGKRMTAEPFDDQDVQLLALLSDYLTRMLLFHEQIRRLAEVPMLLIATEDRERRRLGLELHDRALGYLGGLPLMVGRARQLAGPHVPDDLQRIHTWIEHNAAQVANDLRTIILQLNPQDLSGVRFLPALHAMAGRLCDLSAVTLCWEMTGTWDTLDSTESLHLYRIVEQAITNALQHGQPTVVTISLAVESGQQCIIIHDNGGGFDLSLPIRTGHVGLESMRERARLLGATLEIESSPNNGTLLRLCLNHRIGSVDITNLYHGFEPASAHSPLQRRTIIAKRRWPVEIISVLGLILCVGIGAAAVLFARQTNCSANPAQEQRMIIRGQDSWIGTGICTKPGQHITIRYMSGSWTPNKDSLSNNPFVGAEGYASIMGSWTVSKDTPVGGLIGRIEDGPIHAIGREQTWITERAGELHLRMNDGDCGGCYNDNAGSIEVVITIAP